MTTTRQDLQPRPPPAWMAKVIDRITPSCKAVTQLISMAYDRPLTWKERFQLRLHYRICFYCIRYRDHLDILHQGLCGQADRLPDVREDKLDPADLDHLRTLVDKEARGTRG